LKADQQAASGHWDLNVFVTGSIMRINEPFKMAHQFAYAQFWNTVGYACSKMRCPVACSVVDKCIVSNLKEIFNRRFRKDCFKARES
jgi:hypothetical protein